AGVSLVTRASVTPAPSPTGRAVWTTPAVVGKSVDTSHGAPAHAVEPVMYAAPVPSTAIALPTSVPAPPRYVEYTSAVPAAFSWVTNASRPPASAVCVTPPAVGKFADNVPPVTYAFCPVSIAIPRPTSEPAPPRYVP